MKTAGLSADLGLVGDQFNMILTYYFIPFVLFGPFTGLMTKHFTAKYTIPFMMVGFGAASLGSAFVKNFGQMVACRILVGGFEAGFITT
jgi:MFS family permease